MNFLFDEGPILIYYLYREIEEFFNFPPPYNKIAVEFENTAVVISPGAAMSKSDIDVLGIMVCGVCHSPHEHLQRTV